MLYVFKFNVFIEKCIYLNVYIRICIRKGENININK